MPVSATDCSSITGYSKYDKKAVARLTLQIKFEKSTNMKNLVGTRAKISRISDGYFINSGKWLLSRLYLACTK